MECSCYRKTILEATNRWKIYTTLASLLRVQAAIKINEKSFSISGFIQENIFRKKLVKYKRFRNLEKTKKNNRVN